MFYLTAEIFAENTASCLFLLSFHQLQDGKDLDVSHFFQDILNGLKTSYFSSQDVILCHFIVKVSIIWLMKLFTIVLMEVLSLPFVCNNWQVLVWTGHDIHLTSSPSAFKSSMPNTFSNELCPKGVIVTSYYNFLNKHFVGFQCQNLQPI